MMILALVILICATIPAVTFLINLLFFRRARRLRPSDTPLPAVSILIPARDEEATIRTAVEAALASTGVQIEVVVLDDHSSDLTADIVRSIAANDPRVRLASAPPLPPGWCGKQHACHVLGTLALNPVLLFVDADVRLAPTAAARMARYLQHRNLDLLSAFPRQITVTPMEKLLLPLIHFVLLGFLPLAGLRYTRKPSFAAGCGQLMMARAQPYREIGGHGSIRTSRHDGITLPRAFRRANCPTDILDGTDLAACRMYDSAKAVWQGLAKNATEGLAAPALIVPATLLLLFGQIAPLPLAVAAWLFSADLVTQAMATAALLAAYLPRLLAAALYRQSLTGALLHPVGIALLLAIQWYAFWQARTGRPARWRGRTYATTAP